MSFWAISLMLVAFPATFLSIFSLVLKLGTTRIAGDFPAVEVDPHAEWRPCRVVLIGNSRLQSGILDAAADDFGLHCWPALQHPMGGLRRGHACSPDEGHAAAGSDTAQRAALRGGRVVLRGGGGERGRLTAHSPTVFFRRSTWWYDCANRCASSRTCWQRRSPRCSGSA
jgi:hypothetical protein